MNYAIDCVLLGGVVRTIVVTAADADAAYEAARTSLRKRYPSASLLGCCRVASQSDLDAAARHGFLDTSGHGR